MAGAKETPRQKMIGMMYLVLTALLALNVSKDILDAFVVVNDGLQKTKVNFVTKNSEKYSAFKKAFDDNRIKVGDYWMQAMEVREDAGDLVNYIDEMKAYLISETEKLPLNDVIGENELGQDTVLSLGFVEKKDDYMVPTHLLIGKDPAQPRSDNKFTARRLKISLEKYRNTLANIIANDPTVVDSTNIIYRSLFKTFNFKDGKDASGLKQNWESLNFYDVPLAATITILSKIQTDVLNAESDVISYLFGQVDASSYKFTSLTSVVIPNSKYIFTGDTFRADVFLAAYDPTQVPRVYVTEKPVQINDSTPLIRDQLAIVDVSGSRGHIKIPANRTGDYNYRGLIEFKGPDGNPNYFDYNLGFEVALPTLTVAPTKMNVFYKGVDNPVSISAPGISADDLKPTISNGKIVRDGKDWVVRDLRQGNEADITVKAIFPDGSVKVMGKSHFRVKTVPDPIPSFAGKRPTDTRVKKTELLASRGVIAKLDNFDFELKFTITQFKVTMVFNGTPVDKLVKGNKVSDDMKKMFKKARKGQKVLIENIKAKGADGSIRSLPPISLKII